MPAATSMLDVLAIMAHPDDAELLCGGTLRRAVDLGYRAGVLDLTGGESGTEGSAALRAEEAARAAEILGLTQRQNAGLPDAALQNTPETRKIVAAHIRQLRPRVVITHSREGRHPDHRAASQLAYDACFLAGLNKLADDNPPHRPLKVIFALSFREDTVKPTFVVDVTEQIDRKLAAVAAFASQFRGKSQAGEVFAGGTRPLRDQILAQAAHYGSLIRRAYGEPFWTLETMLVDDPVALGVSTY